MIPYQKDGQPHPQPAMLLSYFNGQNHGQYLLAEGAQSGRRCAEWPEVWVRKFYDGTLLARRLKPG